MLISEDWANLEAPLSNLDIISNHPFLLGVGLEDILPRIFLSLSS